MSKRRSTLLGFYVPSFFEMHVDTDQTDMTINKLPLKDMTTLFHEYIHFLQDFTTYYGLNGLYVHSEYMHSVVTRIYAQGSVSFRVPFQISDNSDNVLLNQQIHQFTEGDRSEKSVLMITDICEDEDILISNPYMSSIPNIIINPEGICAGFGAAAITESMAYIMERCSSPTGYAASPEFPYMAAEKVADFYMPGFSSDPLKILALCDMSLMSSNPGACFVRIMKGVQSGNLVFKTPEDIYDYFYAQKSVLADGRMESTLIIQYKNFLLTVETLLKSYLKGAIFEDHYYEWINHLVAFALDWREHDRYFLLKMARHKDLPTNGCWGKSIHDVGTPLMSNNIPGSYFKIPPYDMSGDMDVEYFKAFHEIEKLFENCSMNCSMIEWCRKSPFSSPNKLCETAPWQKYSEEKLCPYAIVWRNWNLGGKEPVL